MNWSVQNHTYSEDSMRMIDQTITNVESWNVVHSERIHLKTICISLIAITCESELVAFIEMSNKILGMY